MTGKLLYGQDVLVRSFIDSIVNDSEPPVPGREGRRVVELAHKIMELSAVSDGGGTQEPGRLS